jgi:hypothetical protein
VLLLIGVILNTDQVVPEVVEDAGDLDGAGGIAGRGIEEKAELQIVAIVRHGEPPELRRQDGKTGSRKPLSNSELAA